MLVKSLKCLFILFSYTMSYDLPLTCCVITILKCIVVLPLAPGIWYTYLTPNLDPNTWHAIIWYLTIDMLSLDTWHMLSLGIDTLDLMLWHLTGYYYTWHLYYIVYSWLSLLQGPDMIITLLPSGTPELLNSCVSCTHIFYIVTLIKSTVISVSGEHIPSVGLTRMYPTIMLAFGRSWMELSATRSNVSRHTCNGPRFNYLKIP